MSDFWWIEGGTPWVEETIENYSAEHGSVFVFRWVPHFSFRTAEDWRKQPTTAEIAAALAAAAEDLVDGGSIAHREVYDLTHYGVDGHRSMTSSEAAQYRSQLNREIGPRENLLSHLDKRAGATDADA